MKYIILFSIILLYLTNCKEVIPNEDVKDLEYYINYTLIPPTGGKMKEYYFVPNYDVGTVEFILYFSTNNLSCYFECYDGNDLIDDFGISYTYHFNYTLKIPSKDPKPKILRLKVTNKNHEYPYYLYIFNRNYVIPLDCSHYYLYQISLTNLTINYKIDSLDEDIYLKLEAKIEYPNYDDKLDVTIKQEGKEINKTTFNESSSSFTYKLNNRTDYSLTLSSELKSMKFTNNTYFFITFEQKDNLPILFYKNVNITYTTILSGYKWYMIDSINSIDNYNSYNFSILEGYQGGDNKINIWIKKYETYNESYIKDNIPKSTSDYDENYNEPESSFIAFKACENSDPKDKTILIYIELNYCSEMSSLYRYNFIKNVENKQLEFKSYEIKWYTNYDFNPVDVNYADIVFISTNHSNTVFPQSSGSYKKFDTFFNGYLFVSNTSADVNKNKVKIAYSDENAQIEKDDDVGLLSIFKLDNKTAGFYSMEINNIDFKIYSYELMRNCDKYFYIKIDQSKDNYYYIFYEGQEKNSNFTIEEMPVDIIKFSQNYTNSDTTLLDYKKEYLLKLGYQTRNYKLMNIYIIKKEDSTELDLKEGSIKMITYPTDDFNITLKLNIDEEIEITNETYINLKLMTKDNTEVLDIFYSDKIYKLNNSGVNIFNENEERQIILIIGTDHNISKEIPISIKLGIDSNKILYINEKKLYEFNDSNYGVIKYTENKKINMTFKKISSDDVTIYYYNIYLYEDFLNDTSSILSPVIFNNNSKTIESEEYNFEIETELDPERYNNNLNNYLKKSENEELYLFFSFDGKVEIDLSDGGGDDSGGSDSDDKSNTMTYIVIFGIILPLIIIIIVVLLLLYFYFKNKVPKPIERETVFYENITDNATPLNGSVSQQSEKPNNKGEEDYETIKSDDNENNLDNPTNNIEITNMSKTIGNSSTNFDPSQPAAPLASN